MRCLMTLLACGWLLMAPPARGGRFPETPVSEWDHVSSFDTATECEDRREGLQDRAKNDMMKLVWLLSRCIPSDAIRLK